MEPTAKDLGYTVYSRVEESLRQWLGDELIHHFGGRWPEQIPSGVWDHAQALAPNVDLTNSPLDLLDFTYLSDLAEIVCYRGAYEKFFPLTDLKLDDLQDLLQQLNGLRAKVAHVRRSFSFDDLQELLRIGETLCPRLGSHAAALDETLISFKSNPATKLIKIPPGFLLQTDEPIYQHLNNLASADYEMEGGFVGRKDDLKTLKKYLTGNLYRVITISGAGGVGKTALAHHLCDSFLSLPPSRFPFDGIVWISAKEEELTLTGIESLTPKLRTFEDLLDEVLSMFGVDTSSAAEEKSRVFTSILGLCGKGLLFVIDNLETIQDEELIAFIKEVPPPNRVLITSRLGLGEIEKRHPLKSLQEQEALVLFRSVAREKQLHDLASKTDQVIKPLLKSMAYYPLVIKWVLGQVSLGRGIEAVLPNVTSAGGDVAKFCFMRIFETYLSQNDRLLLYALASDERPMTKVVLCHLSVLSPVKVDEILQRLTLASLVINTAATTERGDIETRYELLSLTRQYLSSKLENEADLSHTLKSRADIVRHMLTSGRHAKYSYRYSLKDFGAETEEEKIASTWALTGHQKYVAGSYQECIRMFDKAREFAPKFAPIYRLWASIESAERNSTKASELMRIATTLSPRDPAMWLSRGQVETKAGNYSEAIAHLQTAQSLATDDEIIIAALADAERRAGHFESADKNFMAAIALMESKGKDARQIAIQKTARADNSRRWADDLKLRDRKLAADMLATASKLADEAVELQPEDPAALGTKRQIELARGHVIFALEGFTAAISHYENAISRQPRDDRDKRVNELASFVIADHYLRLGRQSEAKRFLEICAANSIPGSKYHDKLPELQGELLAGRTLGKVDFVTYNKDFGFIAAKAGSRTIKFVRNDLCDAMSTSDFNRLGGRSVSFVKVQTPQGETIARRVVLLES